MDLKYFQGEWNYIKVSLLQILFATTKSQFKFNQNFRLQDIALLLLSSPPSLIFTELPLWLHFLYWLLKATSIPKMQFQSQVFVFACNTTYWDGTSLQSCFILRKVSYKNQCCYNNNIHNQVSMQLLQQYINKSQILKDKSVPKTLALILCIEIVYAYITIPFQVKKCFQT